MLDEDRRAYWERIYSSSDHAEATDDWALQELRKHPEFRKVLELGCGVGLLSELLANEGYDVHATDISSTAIETFRRRAPHASASVLDHARSLPFAESEFDAVISDLSLHYFDAVTTASIFSEIARVLHPDGVLLARVNSSEDYNYGAGVGPEVENGLYEQDGHFKRFFDREMIESFLDGWRDVRIHRLKINRYGTPKEIYQFAARPRIT